LLIAVNPFVTGCGKGGGRIKNKVKTNGKSKASPQAFAL
jgi:hypothetical protein